MYYSHFKEEHVAQGLSFLSFEIPAARQVNILHTRLLSLQDKFSPLVCLCNFYLCHCKLFTYTQRRRLVSLKATIDGLYYSSVLSGTHFEETMYEASQLEHKQYKYNYLLKL